MPKLHVQERGRRGQYSKGYLKNIVGLFLITFVIFIVIRSVKPIIPAKQFEQCVEAVLVGGVDKYAVCVAVFGKAG